MPDFGHNGAMAPEETPPDVLSSLPRTRPQRRSAKRDAAAPKRAAGNGTAAAATPKANAAASTPKAAARPRAAAPRKPRPAPEPRIPPAGFQPPKDQQERPLPSGVELVGTAIQAAGELAQIGLAGGRQGVEGALGRAPGP